MQTTFTRIKKTEAEHCSADKASTVWQKCNMKFRRYSILWMLLMAAGISCPAAEARVGTEIAVCPALTLHFPFRSGTNGTVEDISVRRHHGSLKGDARVDGDRLVLDGAGDFVEVPSSQDLSLGQGLTVAAAVKFDAIKNHIVAGKVDEWLFGFNSEGRLYFNIKAKNGDWSCDTKSAAKIIKAGEWAHVAAVYKPNTDPLAAAKGRVEIYLNGINAGAREMPVAPEETSGPLRIGRLWGDSYQAGIWDMKGEIRDLRIFNRAMDSSEIVSLACNQPGISVAPLAFEVVPDVTGERLGIRAEPRLASAARATLQTAVAKGKAVLTVTVQGPGNCGIAKQEAHFTYDPGTATYWMPYQWSDGSHEVSLSLDGGSSVLTATRQVFKPPTPWLGQGKAPTEVMKPWTPLQTADGRSVDCWGRLYLFDGPFPKSIINQGREMLRAPITLQARAGDQHGRLEETSRSTVSASQVRAEFKGEGAISGIPDLKVSWTSWTEYDGVTHATITLTPTRTSVHIDELTLEIPLRPDMTRYLFGAIGEHPLKFQGHGRSAYRPLRLDGKRVELARFMPYLWLNNLDEGFVWFADSDANWVNRGGRAPIVVDGGVYAGITLRLIDQPVDLNKPVTYSLGFQATPVKPLRDDRFSHRWGETAHQPEVSDYIYLPGFAERTGIWLPVDAPKLKRFIDARRAKGISCYPYGSLNGTGDNNPVYDFFKPLWNAPGGYVFGPFNHAGNFPSYLKDGKRVNPYIGDELLKSQVTHNLTRVNPGLQSYADYLCWTAEELERQAGPTSLYTDLSSHVDPAWTTDLSKVNPAHLKVDQFGRKVFDYQILGLRELARRLAGIVRRYSTPECPLSWMAHDQNRFCPVYHGYADWWFPGEQYDDVFAKQGPFALMDGTISPEQFRVECGGGQASGVPDVLLTHFLGWGFKRDPGCWGASNLKAPPTTEQKKAASDSVIGRCAVEGVEFLASWEMKDAAPEWWKLRAHLGFSSPKTRFLPYWRPGCPTTSRTEQALVSAYAFDGQRAVLVIVNPIPRDRPVEVTVNLAALGWPAGAEPLLSDERTGTSIPWKNGQFTVPVKGMNYTLISLIQSTHGSGK
ncbi:MAG: LamG domain-containing protein [Lentisphaerota bacterium]